MTARQRAERKARVTSNSAILHAATDANCAIPVLEALGLLDDLLRVPIPSFRITGSRWPALWSRLPGVQVHPKALDFQGRNLVRLRCNPNEMTAPVL